MSGVRLLQYRYGVARNECERFLERIQEAQNRLAEDPTASFGCKETAAVMRSSMDLSRALSELRKPRY